MTVWTRCGRRRALLRAGLWLAAGGWLLAAQTAPAPSPPPAKPSPANKCPVCGMFVAPYPDFLAAIVFRDGATAYFDGCKDMFRFVFAPETYLPGRRRADMAAFWVTDYYSLKWVDGAAAFFVRGSDILGPMGHELIPFAKLEEAKQFVVDHKGRPPLRFAEVTPDVLRDID